jgi:Ca-activated chloride channel homolog
MLANDLNPSRIEAAKTAARAFVTQQPTGVRIGVVAFSDYAALVQAPTSDLAAVTAAINRLEPQRGTAIGQGLLTSMNALLEPSGTDAAQPGGNPDATPAPTPTPLPQGMFNPGIIVLLSDGQNTIGIDPIEVAPQVKNRGIRVFTVGVGTPQGTILHLRGRAMRVRLDETPLRRIAEITDGHYFNASTEKDLRAIYENLSRQFGLRTERTELTAIFTGAAALLAVVGGILSLLWFSRLP